MSERMSVPKCKECEFHDGSDIYANKQRHWCLKPSIGIASLVGRFILASEAKTSPKWCPKRLKESE